MAAKTCDNGFTIIQDCSGGHLHFQVDDPETLPRQLRCAQKCVGLLLFFFTFLTALCNFHIVLSDADNLYILFFFSSHILDRRSRADAWNSAFFKLPNFFTGHATGKNECFLNLGHKAVTVAFMPSGPN